MATIRHIVFRSVWRAVNLLSVVAVVCSMQSGVHEYSVRQYLRGFSDAIVPESATAEEKVKAILRWMKEGPSRRTDLDSAALALRDPEVTLNYRQLLRVCGTATNAFLNLSRSAGLSTRRLLLLSPHGGAKHVVAEVLIAGKWVVVDPAYRILFRGPDGRLLTREELKDRRTFAAATRSIPGYPAEYTYDSIAHVRLARLPVVGAAMRKLFDAIFPRWEESLDWSLLLERKSFLLLVASLFLSALFLVLRACLAWYADTKLSIPRFHLREHLARAGAALFLTPEIKQ